MLGFKSTLDSLLTFIIENVYMPKCNMGTVCEDYISASNCHGAKPLLPI